jgi:hypothetical protein
MLSASIRLLRATCLLDRQLCVTRQRAAAASCKHHRIAGPQRRLKTVCMALGEPHAALLHALADADLLIARVGGQLFASVQMTSMRSKQRGSEGGVGLRLRRRGLRLRGREQPVGVARRRHPVARRLPNPGGRGAAGARD